MYLFVLIGTILLNHTVASNYININQFLDRYFDQCLPHRSRDADMILLEIKICGPILILNPISMSYFDIK